MSNYLVLESIVTELIAQATTRYAQFDPQKTELIHFTTQREPVTEAITIAGITINPKEVVKWLGVYFDSKLSFKQYIAKRINLAEGALHRITRLSNTQQKLSFPALQQLYIACITAIADYRAQLWWGKKGYKTLLQPYQKLQNRAIVRITGAFRGSPTKALEVEASIPPPEARLENSCKSYSLRLLAFQKNHPILQALQKSIRDELSIDSEPDLALTAYLQPTTQLASLAL